MNEKAILLKIIEHYNSCLARPLDELVLNVTGLEYIYTIDYTHLPIENPLLIGTLTNLFYQMLGIVRLGYRQNRTPETQQLYTSTILHFGV